LRRSDVLFIDEIHRLRTQVEEYLYAAMEDFKLVIVLDQGSRARTVPLSIHPFTLIGATTREGLLSAPFRARFGIHERLETYSEQELQRIARRTADLLGIVLEEDAESLIAVRARGTPRMVNRFLRRIRDLALVEADGRADRSVVEEALLRIGLDGAGLLPMDRMILKALHRAAPHPMGLKTLAVSVSEEERTIEDVYEPFLLREGFLAKTPRGRVLTEKGCAALGLESPGSPQGSLFQER
jgi:Holliday junction DNA helicase RuvB